MSRLLATLRCDVTVQARHGFYFVSALLVPLLGWLLGRIPVEESRLAAVLPAVMAFSLLITTFFFVGALVLLEKAQASILALATSPIRPGEYLASKAISLTLLGVAEGLAVVVVAFGPTAVGPGLAVGAAVLGALYVLFGFVTIARFDTFNAYLLPAAGATILAILPLLHVTGALPSLAWWGHPTLPALLLMQEPQQATTWIYALAASTFWIVLGFVWARRVYVGATTIGSTSPAGGVA